MYIYAAASIPNDDGIVKLGMTNSPRDRLATYNTSSRNEWAGAFWKINKDPEYWEQELLVIYSSLRISRTGRGYDSELIDGRAALDSIYELMPDYHEEECRAALFFASYDAIGLLLDQPLADIAINKALADYMTETQCCERFNQRCFRAECNCLYHKWTHRQVYYWPQDCYLVQSLKQQDAWPCVLHNGEIRAY